MKTKTWIVAANSCLAKFFNSEKIGVLTEVHSIDHPEGHLRNQDMGTDRPGRSHESNTVGRHSMEPTTAPKRHEAELFARKVADYLDSSREKGMFSRLYVAASPSFLGLLRQMISPATAHLIAGEVDKDFTHMKPKDICENLPFIL